MLSYQHIYHAGNLADVHKHGMLAWMLAYLTAKDKPLTYLETHAGRGLYQLDAPEAVKTGEAAQGIARVADWFAPDHPYARALAQVRALHGPQAYPGSPLLAALSLRPADRMFLADLHPQEVAALAYAMSPYPATVYQRDGAEMALALCPPDPKRGLLLIDPSYEIKDDYLALPGLIRRLHRKWGVGVIVLWYPVLPDPKLGPPHRPMLRLLAEMFAETDPDKLCRHEVHFPPARPGHRMTGSGLFVVNPPYGFAAEAARLTARYATLCPQPQG